MLSLFRNRLVRAFVRSFGPATVVILAVAQPPNSWATGPLTPIIPIVTWSLKDYVSACPAGDTVIAGHPCKLRVQVWYEDANGFPKLGLPPDSIWITTSVDSGNVLVNDVGSFISADDSTRSWNSENPPGAFARLTVPSLSGEGTLRVTLWVSGTNQGYKLAHIRTTDPDASGRVDAGTDQTAPGDIDWNGAASQPDFDQASVHMNDWHRNALHGTPVQRTSFGYVEDGPNSIGEGQVFWSPTQNWLSFTAHGTGIYAANCHVYIASSTPPADRTKDNVLVPVSIAPDTSDYDPSWSPLNSDIAFGRADYAILRKGVPGFTSDTSLRLVAASGTFSSHGDINPAISPDGQWVAFTRLDQGTGAYHIWKSPVGGGQPTQLTFTQSTSDGFPSWSPDGAWLLLDREVTFPNEHHAY